MKVVQVLLGLVLWVMRGAGAGILVDNSRNSFAVSLLWGTVYPQTQHLGDIPPSLYSFVEIPSRDEEMVIFVKRSPNSSLVIHMFVVPVGTPNSTRFTLPSLNAEISSLSKSTSSFNLPMGPNHPCVVSYHSALAFEPYTIMLRSISTEPINILTIRKSDGVPIHVSVINPGELFNLWVMEEDVLFGYKNREDSDPEYLNNKDYLQSLRYFEPEREIGLIFLESSKPIDYNALLLHGISAHMDFNDAYHAMTGRWWQVQFDYFPRIGARTGQVWGASWPMWSSDYIGQVHRISITNSHSSTKQPSLGTSTDSTLTLDLEVISTSPKSFIIENFLSLEEVDVLLSLAGKQPGVAGKQPVPNIHFISLPTRTSEHACIRREDHDLVDTIFQRAAHVFGVSDELLYPFGNAGLSKDLQFIYYNTSGTFTLHSDASVSCTSLRLITLLIYLYDQPTPSAGGETAFPRGGFKVRPQKGNALMYYNLLEDGNVDIDAIHESLPVTQGEKWAASLYFYPTPTFYRPKGAPSYAC